MTTHRFLQSSFVSGLTGIALVAVVAGCGGGDGSGGGNVVTTFRGNLAETDEPNLSSLSRDGSLHTQASVQVCVQGTEFCTLTDANGVFTLAADVSGDVVLRFIANDFTALLSLDDVPPGATIQIEDIHCRVTTGTCTAEEIILVGANLSPVCEDAFARPAELSPPNHELRRIDIDGVVDPDADPVSLTVVAIFQDEPVDEPGSGNTAPDATIDPLALRAERAGPGNGRIYLVEFTAEDGRGGQCMGAVTVCVPHDQGQGPNCVDDGTAYESTALTTR